MPKIGMREIRSEQLTRATIDVIDEVGLPNATMAMIGRKAGLAPSIINHYFQSKSALLEATMRSVLLNLGQAINARLRAADPNDVVSRIEAIVGGNFDRQQIDPKVVKTWLAFWAQSMHDPALRRLQRVNELRLASHLRREIKRVKPADEASFIANTLAALIDGIWLRGALTGKGINRELAQHTIRDYLRVKGVFPSPP